MIKILIVDDEAIERRGIKFLLKQSRLELDILEASNGRDALKYLKKQNIDILFTDIKMPFMNGIELIDEVKKNKIKCRIVIFSGYEEFEYAKFATKMGVMDYILKPIDPAEFKSTMVRIVDEINADNRQEEQKNKNICFLREHLLYTLVNGAAIREIEDKARGLIDLSFIREYKRLCLIEFNEDFFDTNEIDIEKIIKDKVNIKFQYLNLNLKQSLLFFSDVHDDYDEIKELGYAIHDTIKENAADCYVAIGKQIDKIEDICKSYGKIELLIEKKFYNKDTFVFIDEDKYNNDNTKIDTDTILKQIKQDINIKDMYSLKRDFELLCRKYENDRDISQMYVKFIFSNVLKELYESISNLNENKFEEDIDRLYRSTDFAKVIKIMNEYIEQLNNSINDNPNQVHKEIETVKKYIYENYHKDLGVEVLAAQVCFAPSYLSYIFKKETGENISKFIKSCRMTKAKEMLEDSYEKIVNISYAVGYRNVSYFCQSFREYFGVSPQKFRNEGEAVDENI